MKTPLRIVVTLVMAVAVIALTGRTSQAQQDNHDIRGLTRATLRLEAQSRRMYRDLREYTYSNPELRDAARDMDDINRAAEILYRGLHSGYSIDQIHREIVRIERLVKRADSQLSYYRNFRREMDRLNELVQEMDGSIDHYDIHGERSRVTHYRYDNYDDRYQDYGGYRYDRSPNYRSYQVPYYQGQRGFSIQFGR